jgi:general secretion pathway protein G
MRIRRVLVAAAAGLAVFAVALVWYYKVSGNTYYPRDIAAQGDLLGLRTQLELYKKLNGFFPTTEQGLEALVTCPQSSPIPEHWIQQLSANIVDPWHHPYVYRFPNPKDPSTFDLFSLGPDGVESDDDIRVPP